MSLKFQNQIKCYPVLILLITLFGCKDSQQPHSTQTAPHAATNRQLLETLTPSYQPSDPTPQKQRQSQPPFHKNLDLLAYANPDSFEFLPQQYKPLSLFPADDEKKQQIRVSIIIRGISKNAAREYEDKIWELLNAHAPQPWVLRRNSHVEKTESFALNLRVEFKRTIQRLKRASKTVPQRTAFHFETSLSLSGMPKLHSSWRAWNMTFDDEISPSMENDLYARFWQSLATRFPTLTLTDSGQTAQWLRAHGRMPQILTNELPLIQTGTPLFNANGCLITAQPAQKNHTDHTLQRLDSNETPPQKLKLSNIEAVACSKNATYLLTYETPQTSTLYYQPAHFEHSWKKDITWNDSIAPQRLSVHLDDALLCIWTGNTHAQARSLEIECLNTQTGMPKFHTQKINGAFRGAAFDQRQIVFVNDQIIAAIDKNGSPIHVQRIVTRGKPDAFLSCQLQNRLIFAAGIDQLAAYNLDTHQIDWQMSVINPTKLHCSQNHTLIISEAGGYLLAVNVDSDTPLWKYRTMATPLDMTTSGNVLFALQERAIHAIDINSGKQMAQIPLPWRAIQFIPNGARLYIATQNATYQW